MAAVFSIPPYPGATSYNIQYSDPTVGDPNAPNPFGSWTDLAGITPLAAGSESNIIDPTGDPNLRLYRVQPVVKINNTSVPLQWYDPVSVAQSDIGGFFVYNRRLYDPLLTYMLLEFRDFIGDYGVDQTAATSDALDTGAGVGLLQFDGQQKLFYLADIPDATNAIVLQGSINVVKNDVTLIRNTDYVINYEAGSILFAVAPAVDDTCYIQFREAKYSNRMLLAALDNAISSLSHFAIGGYGLKDDNNVRLMLANIPNDGLAQIIYSLAFVILNRAMIRIKSEDARAYKQADFSMDTAPGRIVDAMSKVATDDLNELRFKANNYIRTATSPIVRTLSDGFFDTSNLLPIWPFLMGAGWGWYLA